jgi:hypothetical protein
MASLAQPSSTLCSDLTASSGPGQVWYDLCMTFYVHRDPNGRDAIQWFQNHAPHSSHKTAETLHPETEKCYRQCGIFDCDEERWYQLDRIKNQARQMAHNEGTKQRINNVLYEGQVQNMNQQRVTVSATKHLLQKVLCDLKADRSLGSVVDLIADWIRQQLQYQTCTLITLSASALTERQAEISHHLLLFLCAIGRFIIPDCFLPPASSSASSGPGSGMPLQYSLSPDTQPSEVRLQWIMKEDLSDAHLRSLLKLLPANHRTAKRDETRGDATLTQSERYRDSDSLRGRGSGTGGRSRELSEDEEEAEGGDETLRRLCFCCF